MNASYSDPGRLLLTVAVVLATCWTLSVLVRSTRESRKRYRLMSPVASSAVPWLAPPVWAHALDAISVRLLFRPNRRSGVAYVVAVFAAAAILGGLAFAYSPALLELPVVGLAVQVGLTLWGIYRLLLPALFYVVAAGISIVAGAYGRVRSGRSG